MGTMNWRRPHRLVITRRPKDRVGALTVHWMVGRPYWTHESKITGQIVYCRWMWWQVVVEWEGVAQEREAGMNKVEYMKKEHSVS